MYRMVTSGGMCCSARQEWTKSNVEELTNRKSGSRLTTNRQLGLRLYRRATSIIDLATSMPTVCRKNSERGRVRRPTPQPKSRHVPAVNVAPSSRRTSNQCLTCASPEAKKSLTRHWPPNFVGSDNTPNSGSASPKASQLRASLRNCRRSITAAGLEVRTIFGGRRGTEREDYDPSRDCLPINFDEPCHPAHRLAQFLYGDFDVECLARTNHAPVAHT